jgi:nitronate monooxygenase
MRREAAKVGDAQRMQVWAGQSARLARAEPAGRVLRDIWDGARKLLGWSEGSVQTSAA